MKKLAPFDKHFAEIQNQNAARGRLMPTGLNQNQTPRPNSEFPITCQKQRFQRRIFDKNTLFSHALEITVCPQARAMVQMRVL
jgi:hypothetical protein